MVRFRIIFSTLILYLATAAIAIAAAYRHALAPGVSRVMPVELSLTNAFLFAAVFTLFTVVMIRLFRWGAPLMRILLLLVMAIGAQFVLSAWLSWNASILGALLLVALLMVWPIVLIHDLTIVFGIAGIAGVMGLSITPLVAAVLLAVLSLYDIISVYRTRHMVALAGRMIESGSVLGFLVPARWGGFFMKTRQALDARQVMMLGSGDIALPLVLAGSLVTVSLGASVVVAAFALAGVMVMYWLFMRQEQPMPMAALPPIAASALIGLLIATLLSI